jgi:hypothetical protein
VQIGRNLKRNLVQNDLLPTSKRYGLSTSLLILDADPYNREASLNHIEKLDVYDYTKIIPVAEKEFTLKLQKRGTGT